MKKIEVYRTTPKGDQEVFFTVTMDEGVVDISGAPSTMSDDWEKYGIPLSRLKKTVKPSDGAVFLEALSMEYKGSMVRSGPIEEE